MKNEEYHIYNIPAEKEETFQSSCDTSSHVHSREPRTQKSVWKVFMQWMRGTSKEKEREWWTPVN
jgi:hypothetical protein